MSKRRIVALAALPAVLCTALAAPALAATKTITVGDDFFKSDNVSVSKGTTMKWVWKGKSPHNVRVTSGPQKFASQVQTSGTFSQKVNKAGAYTIVCTIHPGMDMTLKVR